MHRTRFLVNRLGELYITAEHFIELASTFRQTEIAHPTRLQADQHYSSLKMPYRSPYRDALRLLFILVHGCSPLISSKRPGVYGLFVGEARLLAFEFWLRYPDYLAEELLDLFDATQNRRYLEVVERIFAHDEPDIRRFPMIRYRFGAYERLDDALSILVSRGLLQIVRRVSGDKVLETDFLVMNTAVDLAKQIANDIPELTWYAHRAEVVSEIAGNRGGAALKQRQYERVEYAETLIGGFIPPITAEVRARFRVTHSKLMETEDLGA